VHHFAIDLDRDGISLQRCLVLWAEQFFALFEGKVRRKNELVSDGLESFVKLGGAGLGKVDDFRGYGRANSSITGC
jgi:hypothetical protein